MASHNLNGGQAGRLRPLWAGLASVPMLAMLLIAMSGCAGSQFTSSYPVPEPDGSACYDQRRQFYNASNDAVAAEGRRKALETTSGFLDSQWGQFIFGKISKLVPGQAGSLVANDLPMILSNLARYASDDTILIRTVSDRFDGLVRCRRTEVNQVRRDMRAHSLSRAEAQDKAASIRKLAQTDADVAHDVNMHLSVRTQRLNEAVAQIDTSLPSASDPTVRQQRAKAAEVHQTVQTNQRALQTQKASIDRSTADPALEISDFRFRSWEVRWS